MCVCVCERGMGMCVCACVSELYDWLFFFVCADVQTGRPSMMKFVANMVSGFQ